jgi:hypothetical protein
MKRVLLITAVALLATACSRQTNPQPTPASQSDNAAASAPNGVGSQQQDAQRSATGTTAQGGAPPSATGVEQAGNPTQSATSRSSADQQGVTASPPQ